MIRFKSIIYHFLIPLSIFLMWAGMFWSRALLSTSMIFFILLSILAGSAYQALSGFRKHLWIALLPVLFVVPMVSGIWSIDKENWLGVLQTKLPLLLLPFSTCVLTQIHKASNRLLWYCIMIFSCLACLVISINYFQSYMEINQGYLRAMVLKVPMENDHVRFSWALLLLYLVLLPVIFKGDHSFTGLGRKFSTVVAIFLGVFFHLLATKTGLVGFYLLTILGIIWLTDKRMRLLLLTGLILLPLVAWLSLPTFRNRIKFVRWDFQNYSRGQYVEGLSDAPRVISYQAGTEIVGRNLWKGVGFGDIPVEMDDWYETNRPELKDYERVFPENEFLFYSVGAGILAGLIMMWMAAWPFFMRSRRKDFLWIGFHLLAFSGFLYEIGLEVQYGVFIYAFFGGWLYWRNGMESASSVT